MLPPEKSGPKESASSRSVEDTSSWLPLQVLTLLALWFGIVACNNTDSQASGGAMTVPPDSFHNANEVRRDSGGTVARVKGDNLAGDIELDRHYESLMREQSYDEMAQLFVQNYRIPFQLVDPNSEAVVSKVQGDNLGYHQVRLTQVYRDIPVLNTEMIVHFNPQDHVYLVQSQFIPTPIELVVIPALTEDEVVKSLAQPNLTLGSAALAILPREHQRPILVYTIEMRRSLVDSRSVVVDANSGAILQEIPTVYNTR